MRGVKRLTGFAVAAAALAAAGAGPASAMIGPACDVRLAAPATASNVSCGFDSNTDWAYITVEPVNSTVTATVRCNNYPYNSTYSRTVSERTTWTQYTPGSCSLSLSSSDPIAIANGTASPWIPPIYDPPPPA